MRRWSSRLSLVCLLSCLAAPAPALDPPHDFSQGIECADCHTTHEAPGAHLLSVAGNSNLCLSCHVVGGPATDKPFADADQALPGPGLPAGDTPTGDSHRWDSGPAGHVRPDSGNASTGTLESRGAFTGRYAKTYTITISGSGDSGVASFAWIDTLGGSAGGLLSGTGVVLDQGISVDFGDGASSPAFVAGDSWDLFVRTDIALPLDPELATRLDDDGKVVCSTCHNQHSQAESPFAPFNTEAPPYTGPGSGAGRMFQRADNTTNQMCNDCHRARYVDSSALGSHPVGHETRLACISCHSAGGTYIPDPILAPTGPLMSVECMTCHAPHYAPTSDGTLARAANANTLCANCHQIADIAGGAHFDPGSGVLWPGGQYGSTFPAITDPAKRGTCSSCHQPHGWPDGAMPSQDYPLLLVDREEKLCYTCHDGDPAPVDIMVEFGKASAHPLTMASGTHAPDEPVVVTSRHVECDDCHNSHRARAVVSVPGPSTAARSTAGPLTGARGVRLAGNELNPAALEYQVCFRCHADSPGQPAAPTPRQFPEINTRLEFDGSHTSFHAVAVTGTLNAHVPSLFGGWTSEGILACTSCHNNDDGPGNGGSGPQGPHGSARPNLLERRYETNFGTYSSARYALCFKCHSSSTILDGDVSFKEHDKHIDGEDTPCNVCHDPHASEGQKFLINFDTSAVFPSPGAGGRFEFIAPEDSVDGKGYCYMRCHGQDHDPFDYEPNY